MNTVVRCPRCGTPTTISSSNEFRPFCSGRCRNVDLHAWATSQYRIAGELSQDLRTDDAGEELKINRSGFFDN